MTLATSHGKPSTAPDLTAAETLRQARQKGDLRFVWIDPEGRGRNRFAIFRRVFTLPEGEVRQACLHLFAECRYRLTVNGRFVSSGPGRYVPEHPEFDTIDLGKFLWPGRNVVEVVVNAFGASSYQVMPGSIGAFLAAGTVVVAENAPISLDTPGSWRGRKSCAWEKYATAFSFAQGPVEILDTRKLPGPDDDEGFLETVVLEDQQRWGDLRARSIPPLTFEPADFPRIVFAAEAADDEDVYFVPFRRTDEQGPAGRPPHPIGCVAGWLYSPKPQEIVAGGFWGPYFLNGQVIEEHEETLRGNRLNLVLPLREGWNLFYGEVELLKEIWTVLLGLPRDAGVQVRTAPDFSAPAGLLYAGPFAKQDVEKHRPSTPKNQEDLENFSLAWAPADPSGSCLEPARLMAWQRPREKVVLRQTAFNEPLRLPVTTAAGAMAVLDFEGEFLGHPIIEIEAPAGTIIDLGYDERLRQDGCLGLYRTNPFVNAVDRFIARGGRQTIQGFHVRGGRYLQVTIHLPEGEAPGEVTMHRAGVCRTQIAVPGTENFACDDEIFNWTWRAGLDTVRGCLEELYLDCPWRERGTYLGDSYVIQRVHRLVEPDHRVIRRVLGLFAEGRRGDGQMPAVVPAWHRRPHEDFTLIWILALRNHWAWTGDRALVEDLWPALEAIWSSSRWKTTRDSLGLWTGDDLHLFIDWGVSQADRTGPANAVLNALRYRALQCSAELADALGRAHRAEEFRSQAAQVRSAFNTLLWDSAAGRYRATTDAAADDPNRGLHGNILAALFGLPDAGQLQEMKPFLLERARQNLRRGCENGQLSGHCELYFLNYLLDLLYDLGEVRLAEDLIREHYGFIRDNGGWTIWECFSRGAAGLGSLCHAWSTAPNFVLMERTLGFAPAQPGDPTRLVVSPNSATLRQAQGTYAHPAGPVTVHWQREGHEFLRVKVKKPGAVQVQIAPAGELANLAVKSDTQDYA